MPWSNRLRRRPFKPEIPGSSPGGITIWVGMPSWSRAADCKSVTSETSVVQIHPDPPKCGCSSTGRAPACHAGGCGFKPRQSLHTVPWSNWLRRQPLKLEIPGSSPGGITICAISSMVEQRPFKARVPGSSPGWRTICVLSSAGRAAGP